MTGLHNITVSTSSQVCDATNGNMMLFRDKLWGPSHELGSTPPPEKKNSVEDPDGFRYKKDLSIKLTAGAFTKIKI